MITVYGFSPSGNCHKVKLLLGQLGREYRWIETDSARGATRTPEYLAKNPNGKVPMIELDDGRVLVESNAILCWLADGTKFLPSDPWAKAQALGRSIAMRKEELRAVSEALREDALASALA